MEPSNSKKLQYIVNTCILYLWIHFKGCVYSIHYEVHMYIVNVLAYRVRIALKTT